MASLTIARAFYSAAAVASALHYESSRTDDDLMTQSGL